MYYIPENIEVQKPKVFLTKPNKKTVGKFNNKYIMFDNHEINMGSLNRLRIRFPYKITHEGKTIKNPHVSKIKKRYFLKIVINGEEEYYIINELKREMDLLEVQAFSLGYELNDKTIIQYEGVSKNINEVTNDALQSSLWSLGDVDFDLTVPRRQFIISNQTVLNFIFEIAEKFNAIVSFDTVNRRINFKKQENIGRYRGLSIKYGKYLKDINHSQKADEMVTRLTIYGNDNLTINSVNATGTNYIESFNYFLFPFERDSGKNTVKSSHYMSDKLCHAILDYEEKVESYDGQFSILLDEKSEKITESLLVENELFTLDSELMMIEDQLFVANATGSDQVGGLIQQKNNKEYEISQVEDELFAIYDEINYIDSEIESIIDDLRIENNFSNELINERNQYIIHRTYSNNNILEPEDLLQEGKKAFDKMRVPKTLVNMSIADFLSSISESHNWDKLNIGDKIRILHEEADVFVEARITKIIFNYNDRTSISLEISDSADIKNDEDSFISRLNQSYSTSVDFNMNKVKYEKTSDDMGEVYNIIHGTWDANLRRIQAGTNESVTVDNYGLRIVNPDYPNDILVGNSGVLAISNDGGDTFKNALTKDGLVAERVFGKLIAGVNLSIENDAGKFTFDSDGVVVDGSSFEVTGGSNGVVIDPNQGIVVTDDNDRVRSTFNATDGIKIETRQGDNWRNSLYYDPNQLELVVDGSIVAKKIILGDQNILTSDGLKINAMHVDNLVVGETVEMGSSASISWSQVLDQPTASDLGGLESSSPMLTNITSTGIYTGTIEAGQVNTNTLSAITANLGTVNAGTINGVQINSANIDISESVSIGEDLWLNAVGREPRIYFYNNSSNPPYISHYGDGGLQLNGNIVVTGWGARVVDEDNINNYIPYGTSYSSVARGNHSHSGYASSSHTHSASDVTSGTFSTFRIPNLDASKITSGTFNSARIPDSLSFDSIKLEYQGGVAGTREGGTIEYGYRGSTTGLWVYMNGNWHLIVAS